MSFEQSSKNQSLSEISHLFLSSVREKHNNGSPRPRRIGPGQPRPTDSLDGKAQPQPRITPQELDSELAESSGPAIPLNIDPAPRTPPVSALLSVHLNERQFECVKDYARHLASVHGRIGLIEIGLTEFRLMSFEAGHSL